MQVRPARGDDLAAVARITVAAYEPFLLGPQDGYVARLADAAGRHREAELLVAVDEDGTVAGNVTVCPPGSPWREVAAEGEGEFRMLAVAPAAQGRGVGALLVDAVLERCSAQACHRVVLSSLPEMAAAHRLYARAGFRRLPERDWWPVPDQVQLICFGKETP